MNHITKYICLSVLICLCACEKETDPTLQPSEIQKEVIINELSHHKEVSEFTAMVSDLDVTDIKADELTVFAVENTGLSNGSDTKSAEVQDLNILRHFVVGAYPKSALKNGTSLTALDGTDLVVTIMGDQVFINGSKLGKEINAGKNIAFIVDKVLSTEAMTKEYSMTVYMCNSDWQPSNPVNGYLTADAEVTIFDQSNQFIGTYKTDTQGKAIFTLVKADYFYKVQKDDASNITKDGYLIRGIFTSEDQINNWPEQLGAYPKVLGGLKLADINGDAIINDEDKVEHVSLRREQDVYIAHQDFASSFLP